MELEQAEPSDGFSLVKWVCPVMLTFEEHMRTWARHPGAGDLWQGCVCMFNLQEQNFMSCSIIHRYLDGQFSACPFEERHDSELLF